VDQASKDATASIAGMARKMCARRHYRELPTVSEWGEQITLLGAA
jgi:hypothetical protein